MNSSSTGLQEPENESSFSRPWVEADWRALLRRIEDEKVGVVPVLGPDLSRVMTAGGDEGVTSYLARELAKRLSLPADQIDPSLPFDSVAVLHAKKGGNRITFSEELCELVTTLDLPMPEPLRQLADIEPFSLFVTTAVDPMFARALKEARGDPPEIIAYAPRQPRDIPATLPELRRRGQCVLYHLLGEPCSAAGFWGVTEEDQLEFYHALQAPNRQPERLFSEFRERHLLLLGGGYPDWLARFFLRTLRGEALSRPRGVEELVADPAVVSDARLRTFLEHYSPQTRLHPAPDPCTFIAELHRRYRDRHPGTAKSAQEQPPDYRPPPPRPPAHAVFISYARENRSAVQRLYAALSRAGIPAWFDLEGLEGGDEFKRKIVSAIDAAQLFLPIISRETAAAARHPRFFHFEWNYAAARVDFFPQGRPFVLPVYIDDLPEAEAPVPDRFLEFLSTRLPGGEASAAWIEMLRRTLNSVG